MDWENLSQELYVEELTPEELQALSAHEAMVLLQRNMNMLARINNYLLVAAQELGRWRTRVELLKHTKNTLIEQNRALKEILKAERW